LAGAQAADGPGGDGETPSAGLGHPNNTLALTPDNMGAGNFAFGRDPGSWCRGSLRPTGTMAAHPPGSLAFLRLRRIHPVAEDACSIK